MANCLDETCHTIFLGKFENSKNYKAKIVKEIIAAICAMLNSNGGKVVLDVDTGSNDIPLEGSPFSKVSLLIRILEQSMISIIGERQTVLNVHFKHSKDRESLEILVKKAYCLVTTSYNLCLPSESQVVQVSSLELFENIWDYVVNRIVIEPLLPDSHCKIFHKGKNSGLYESKSVEFKYLRSTQSKNMSLADRMTSKANKLSYFVSAFANYKGGHVYYGITDNGVVEGELVLSEERKEIRNKIAKTINKMFWPEHIGQPKRGKQWEIFFEQVEDENSSPIQSTFVIVIYIASCPGGVFTDEPECYEMLDGKVSKMSIDTWMKRLSRSSHNILPIIEAIPPSVSRISWSSDNTRKAFTSGDDSLMRLINNAKWDLFDQDKRVCNQYKTNDTKLLVLSKQITACYRRKRFDAAYTLLEEYERILRQLERDQTFFEVMQLYLQAALKRACGDFDGLEELIHASLAKADTIEAGLVTAIVYIFAGTVTDLIETKKAVDRKLSPEYLSITALQHLKSVTDFSQVLADMQQKAYITLATFYLSCNIRGQPINDSIDISSLDKAKRYIMAVHDSVYRGNPMSAYREVQLCLLQSIFNYRYSQIPSITTDKRHRFLDDGLKYAENAEHLASKHNFAEMSAWSKANKCLCEEELRIC